VPLGQERRNPPTSALALRDPPCRAPEKMVARGLLNLSRLSSARFRFPFPALHSNSTRSCHRQAVMRCLLSQCHIFSDRVCPLGHTGDQAVDVQSCRWETAARPWKELWIEEPQGQGRLLPRPVLHKGKPTQRGQGRRDRDTLPATFQPPIVLSGRASRTSWSGDPAWSAQLVAHGRQHRGQWSGHLIQTVVRVGHFMMPQRRPRADATDATDDWQACGRA
jgi:hypothetical protein